MVADSCVADGDLHFPPCRTCVSPVDRLPAELHFSLHLCHNKLTDDIVVDANEELPRSGFGTTELVDANLVAGCGATEFVDDNLGIVPPHVDWAGIPLAQDGPWLKGVDRTYIEVSSVFVLGLGPSIMWGRCFV